MSIDKQSKTKESKRLAAAYAESSGENWLAWGPYLSERQWGTVREDYSAGGDAWDYFPHEQARSRAYRWGEDGLAGISDDQQQLCFALALWNGQDPILKERLFGLTNNEGNHGEDVKEYYYFLDNTPTHSWMRWLYKCPQRAFPYDDLVAENARRKREEPGALEYELIDTGAFAEDRYFDVEMIYAKAGPADICIRINVTNRGPDPAQLDVLPTLWFRNTWSWAQGAARPQLDGEHGTLTTVQATAPGDPALGMVLYCQRPDGLLFVDNETNNARLWGAEPMAGHYPKDGINDHVVHGSATVNPDLQGTKAAARWTLDIDAGATRTVQLRLAAGLERQNPFDASFGATFKRREAEADAFWASVTPPGLSDDRAAILRQASAGMLWSKQLYRYNVNQWLQGDEPAQPAPPPGRNRNSGWVHFNASNVLSMPDTWEYPWFAAWDLCFQAVVFARIDVQFAKRQLLTLAREWFMSPDGALPAYEWAFDDVNPPLHAWAALRIFEIEQEMHGVEDFGFLEDIFRYGLMYFTWWSNRKDADGDDIFGGGFLGLDNISIIDRSHLDPLEKELHEPVEICQSDGTSWMGMFSLNMMDMAMRLARTGGSEYARLADKFLQHFVFITDAINGVHQRDGQEVGLWDETDGYYYDELKVGAGDAVRYLPVRMRSVVGVIALFPCLALDVSKQEAALGRDLQDRLNYFLRQHPELFGKAVVTDTGEAGVGDRHLLSFANPDQLRRILGHVLDENELLSPFGVRGLSQAYRQPDSYTLQVTNTVSLSAAYEPAESSNGMFGGNSNWRGPIWFPINFLLIEALDRYHEFLGDGFTVEFPTGSGRELTLQQVADQIADRLITIFERGQSQQRPVFGANPTFQNDPQWRDHLLFYEYFNGDNGAGVGASHQTGWTGLVAELLRRPTHGKNQGGSPT
jgi:hypothetical protein